MSNNSARRRATETTRPRLFADKFRWVILTGIVVITVINYVDRGAISYAAEGIMGEYALDPAEWGNVLGFFGYGYMFGALIGGFLADKMGPKWMWTVATLSWSVLVVGVIFAGDLGVALAGSALVGFAVFRITFGLAEGPTYATVNRTVANWATVKERGFMSAVGLLGTPLGALLTAPIAVGLITLTGSWRWVFVILGAAGFVWLFWWLRIFTNRPDENPRVSEIELRTIRSQADVLAVETTVDEPSRKLAWWDFFKSRTLVFNAIGYFAFMYVNFMILTWTPRYLQSEFGFELGALWYLGMIPWIGACFTVLFGGRISDWLRRRTGSLWIARSGFAMVSLALTTICFLFIPTLNSAAAVLVVMAIGNALNSLPNAVYWTVVIDTAPERTGTFGGMTHFIANIAAVAAPTITGYLVSASGFGGMFIATGVATGIGVIAMALVRPGRLGAPARRSTGVGA